MLTRFPFFWAAVVCGALLAPAGARGQDAAAAEQQVELRFNFTGAPWQAVLEWLAEEADLSLQIDSPPPGSFTFSDPTRTYTPSEAMDVINRVLLDKGYALVRRGRMLLLIDYEDEIAPALIRELAELVAPEELDQRADSDLVKAMFPLGGMSADAAERELSRLVGPPGSVVVIPSADRVLVTETAGKLRTIRDLLEEGAGAGEVTEIRLRHVSAEEVLAIARPLLGMEEGENESDGLRVATDLFGSKLYASGDALRLRQLERIVEKVDQPLEDEDGAGSTAAAEKPELRTYPLGTADSQTVMDVLSTLLAGLPDVRLATDPRTDNIIAFARPADHEMIRRTLDELEGRSSGFEVLQLRRLDPQSAVLTINKFFGRTEEEGKGPTVDGDPATGRLWVRGTNDEIEAVRRLIDQLEGSSEGSLGERIRVLPYSGSTASSLVDQVEALWGVTGRRNEIRMVTPSARAPEEGLPQRRTHLPQQVGEADDDEFDEADPFRRAPRDGRSTRRAPEGPAPNDAGGEVAVRLAVQRSAGEPSSADQAPAPEQGPASADRLPSAGDPLPPGGFSPSDDRPPADRDPDSDRGADGEGGDIVVTLTPGGLVIASEDAAALADFEALLETLAERQTSSSAQPTVFWLKYAKATAAAELVNSILSGESGASGGSLGEAAGSLMGELGGGMLGGLLGLGGGGDALLTASGSVSIVPDARLNALIIQAAPADMVLIEELLKVIDRAESPESVEASGRPQLIPVLYQDAEAVAGVVRSVYGDRIAGNGGGGGGGGGGRQPSPQDLINALQRAGGRGGAANSQENQPPTMTIGVDKRSNSLVVTAQPQLFEEVRELVESIDQAGIDSEESVEVVSLAGRVNPEVVQKAVASILGAQVQTSSTSSDSNATASSSDSSSGDGDGPNADQLRQRMEFLRNLQQRGGGRGGSRGGFRGRGGGGFGGGGRGGRGG